MRVRAPFVIAMLLACATAYAQTIEPPARPSRGVLGGGRPPDPNRTRQELVLGIEALGGHDDNLAAESSPAAPEFAPRPSGYMGYSNIRLSYFVGRSDKFLKVTGRSFMNTYRNVGIKPNYGGELNLNAETGLGRRVDLFLRQSVSYDPFFTLGSFGALQSSSATVALDSAPTMSLTESRSWTMLSGAGLLFHATQGSSFGVNYDFSKRLYETGVAFDSQMHLAGASFQHALSRAFSFTATYTHRDLTTVDFVNFVRPLRDNGGELGLLYDRALSRTRRLTVAATTGSVRVATWNDFAGQHLAYSAPSGSASARLDLGRSWTAVGTYRRNVSVLQGIRPDQFVGDAVSASLGGFLSSRLEAAVVAAYSNGHTGTLSQSTPGTFESYTATAQMRVRITRLWSATVGVTRYRYDLNAAASGSLGLPPRTSRRAIRVGLTTALPLLGSYLDRPAPLSSNAGGGN